MRSYVAFAISLLLSCSLQAAFPEKITYQGALKEDGYPLSGSAQIEIRLTNEDGSTIYWASGAQSVSIVEGLYKLELSPTGVDWAAADAYVETIINGTLLLPREKLTSTPYAFVARDLAVSAEAKGDLKVKGQLTIIDDNPAASQEEFIYSAESNPPGTPFQLKFGFRNNLPSIQSFRVGVGTNDLLLNPDGGLVRLNDIEPTQDLSIFGPVKIFDPNPAGNQDELVYSAESDPPGTPFQLKMGFRHNTPTIQSYRAGVGPNSLFINPDGGSVSIGYQTTSPLAAKLVLYNNDNGGGVGKTNTLVGAGYGVTSLNGNRQFWVQQWLNTVTARTFLVGNGFVEGDSGAQPVDGPYTKFSAIEFGDQSFGFVYNNAGTISPSIVTLSNGGNVGIKTSNPQADLDVNGHAIIHGMLKSEHDKPAFLVSVLSDDCGNSHPYFGCPSGYTETGRWYVGYKYDACSPHEENGVGYENGTIKKGQMVHCVAH